MERNVLRCPGPPDLMGVNVLTTALGQHSHGLGFAGPIGDADPQQQSTICYVLLQGLGMLLADRLGGKAAKTATRQSPSDGGSDG